MHIFLIEYDSVFKLQFKNKQGCTQDNCYGD